MSLLNVWVSPERALVAVDSLGKVPDGPTISDVSKIYSLPGVNVVIAGRGQLSFSLFAYEICHRSALAHDQIVDNLAAILSQASDVLHTINKASDMAGKVDIGPQELLLVGWSQRQGGFQGIWCKRERVGENFSLTSVDPLVCAPVETQWGALPVDDFSTAANMETMARWQVQHGRQMFPGQPLGGRILIAELSRDSVTVKAYCDAD